MGQAERDAAIELRATAPLLAGGKPIGTITLVTAGSHTIGFTSAELCRRNEAAGLAVGTKLDGSASIPLKWSMGRYTGVGLVEPTAPIPADAEIAPLPIAAVCATIDTRGAPAALIAIHGGKRVVLPVYVDPVGGMDVIARLATPIDAPPADLSIEGCPLFAWFPPERVLGRAAATLVCAIGYHYRQQTFKPRDRPAIAELVGLEDLGRAMPRPTNTRDDPAQVAGELEDHELPHGTVE